MTRVAYLGNVGPGSVPHSTENHVARALETNGVTVDRFHERQFPWDAGAVGDVDFVLWQHTHDFAPERTHDRQFRWLDAMRERGVPVVSFHLDRYWDLYRETQIYGPGKEPFFSVDLMVSADGGNDDRWAEAGVPHLYMPPGVSEPECEPGTHRPALASDIAFVGSWNGYHEESRHRYELVTWLRDTYGGRCQFWPRKTGPAVRNEQLRDLYASVKVLVGDSCFSGDPRGRRYCSDRVPETVGRGGLLIHPDTEGITDGGAYTAGEHLLTWPAWDWDALAGTIDAALTDDDLRHQITTAGRAHVLENHTYEVRMRDLLADLAQCGLIRAQVPA